jgi:hypothetical protein
MLDRLEERELRIVPRVGHQSGHLKASPAPKSEGLPPSIPRT